MHGLHRLKKDLLALEKVAMRLPLQTQEENLPNELILGLQELGMQAEKAIRDALIAKIHAEVSQIGDIKAGDRWFILRDRSAFLGGNALTPESVTIELVEGPVVALRYANTGSTSYSLIKELTWVHKREPLETK